MDQKSPFTFLKEQARWFRPAACLLFLIQHVYAKLCDKNLNWQCDSWFAVLFFSTSFQLSSHQSNISVDVFKCLALNDKSVHPNWDSVPIIHRQRCHQECNIWIKMMAFGIKLPYVVTCPIISFCCVRQDENNNEEQRNHPKGQINSFVVCQIVFILLSGTFPCHSWILLIPTSLFEISYSMLFLFTFKELQASEVQVNYVGNEVSCWHQFKVFPFIHTFILYSTSGL